MAPNCLKQSRTRSPHNEPLGAGTFVACAPLIGSAKTFGSLMGHCHALYLGRWNILRMGTGDAKRPPEQPVWITRLQG